MSRKVTNGTKANGSKTTASSSSSSSSQKLPPSHPAEQVPLHRQFLMRSLERNDADLAALQELNRSLHSVKQAILKAPGCHGERTLIALGKGLLRYDHNDTLFEADDDDGGGDGSKTQGKDGEGKEAKEREQESRGDDVENEEKKGDGSNKTKSKKNTIMPETEEGKDLCLDFLLRRTLRRKLLNRLARRLNRIASAMDGNDVNPPPPPRYGDLRLNVDPESVKSFEEHFQRQERARLLLEMEREKYVYGNNKEKDSDVEAAAHDSDTNMDSDEKERKGITPEAEEKQEKTEPQQQADDSENKSEARAGGATGASPKSPGVEEQKAKQGETEHASTSSDGPAPPDTAVSSSAADSVPPGIDKPGAKQQQNEQTANDSTEEEPGIDYDAFKDYDEPYEKRVHGREVSYTVLDQVTTGSAADLLDDFSKIRYGAGIGAVHRTMSVKEKEAEFKKWQSQLLAKIPDQPTFDDLGMGGNSVFLEDVRMKRAVQAEEEEKTRKKAKIERSEDDVSDNEADEQMKGAESEESEKPRTTRSKKKNEEQAAAEADAMDVDDKEGNGEDIAKESGSPSKDTEKEENEEENETVMKRVMPISLAAVPSFYDQDLLRIRNVHYDLMASSIKEYTRKRLEDSATQYNIGKYRYCHVRGSVSFP